MRRNGRSQRYIRLFGIGTRLRGLHREGPLQPHPGFRLERGNEGHYQNVAQALYYAMYMFAKSTSGEHCLLAPITARSNITSFTTTACSSCSVHVFVINQEQKASGLVEVNLHVKSGVASPLMLKAPNLHVLTTDVRYGGAVI